LGCRASASQKSKPARLGTYKAQFNPMPNRYPTSGLAPVSWTGEIYDAALRVAKCEDMTAWGLYLDAEE
jgi:hypothetical protein